MANALLDFVMSLVRDPDAAARYAADPAQAIADAALTDVTSVDVQNLIPVVAESLSMATPSHGLDALGVESASNVWASGAATSAFDAFADNVPESAVRDTYSVLTDIADSLEKETWRRLDLFVRLLEPVMLLLLASGVLVRSDYYVPVNTGNALGYEAFYGGEFAAYDEVFPLLAEAVHENAMQQLLRAEPLKPLFKVR